MKALTTIRITAIFLIFSLMLLVFSAAAPNHNKYLSICLYAVCLLDSVILSFFLWRESKLKILAVMPFVILFLYGTYRISRSDDYRWGADDAFYYSYMPSAFLDHDLNLANQYAASGIPDAMESGFMENLTARGVVQNTYPVGPSLLWSPFFLLGSGIAHFFQFTGIPVALDGYSRPYVSMTLIGNLLYVCCGLYFCFRFAASYFSRAISLISTFGLLLTFPHLYFFFKFFQLLSEPIAMAAVAAVVFLYKRHEQNFSPKAWFLTGVLSGLAILVRFHNAMFLLIPTYVLLRPQKWKTFGAFCLGLLLGVLPQLFVWRGIYGIWFLNFPQQFLTSWRNPFLLETLFSSRKGLFPWQPILVFAIPGLILFRRKDKKWTVLFCVIFCLMLYLNASIRDWWGSVSFGSRRFLPGLILFTTGFASFYSWLVSRRKRMGHAICIALLLFLGGMVYSIGRTYSRTGLELYHSVRFSEVFHFGLNRVYAFVAYAMEFPAQLIYHLRYKMPMYGSLSEYFIGDDILFLQQRSVDFARDPQNPIFGNGWKFENQQWSCPGGSCTLHLPMFFISPPELRMRLSAEASPAVNRIRIDFLLNGEASQSKVWRSDDSEISFRLNPSKYLCAMNTVRLQLHSAATRSEPPVLFLRDLHFEEPEK